MRVLHIRSSAGFFGAERVLLTLLARLPEEGVEPVLAVIRNYRTGNRELLERAQEAGVRAVEVPCGGRFRLRTVTALKTLARAEGAKLVHTHDYKSHVHGALAARALGLPAVATLHGWISTTPQLRFYQWIERVLLKRFAAVVTVAPAMLERLRAAGYPAERLHTVLNGVDTERFRPDRPGLGRSRWGLGAEDYVFGTVARLSPEKGHRDLLAAFAPVAARHARARLLLAGDGPERGALETLAADLGLKERVTFAGTEKQVEALLHDLDCYVSPSLTEGMPMVVLEAMASGVPVIATRVGEVGAMLEDGAGGLVPPGAPEALEAALEMAVTGAWNGAGAARLARERCVARYSARAQGAAYARLYGQVAGARP